LRRFTFIAIVVLALISGASGFIGNAIGPGVLHPTNLNPERLDEAKQVFARTNATRTDFTVRASDGVELRGWKVVPPSANGDWVLLFHGVSDNRTGDLGHAEFLLRHSYSVVMMDSRAHGESGGDMATYGWKERYDTVAITDALYSTEKVRHLYAHGVSMGAAIAQDAAKRERSEIRVASAGIAALEGEPAHELACEAVEALGLSLASHRAQGLTRAMMADAALVLAVTKRHRDDLRSFFPNDVAKIVSFDEVTGLGDLVDPFGDGPDAFARTAELLERGMPAVLAAMRAR